VGLTLELEGFLDEIAQGDEGGGVVVAIFGPVPLGFTWEVDRAVVSSTSSTVTEARMFKDVVANHNLVSGSAAGNFDEADYSEPIRLQGGQRLIVRWTGASPGARSTARAEGRIFRSARNVAQRAGRRYRRGAIPGGR
jgi:hypothetical protein